jgi:acyl-[acyl-carrier-protein]-phospholipid O-acyltransferase/long-chain-fatty-acid--[acyl-carrier-protein] ligase
MNAQLPKGFQALVVAQSLGALNDNLFKTLLQLYVLQIIVLAHPETIIAQAAFIFTVPFIVFGPWAGYLADRFDKVNLIRLTKLAEIGIMILGAVAFILSNVPVMLFVLFLLAVVSTFFNPAKAGLIPEVCPSETVNKANSHIEATTLVAIIIGIAATGALLSFHQNNALTVTYYGLGVAAIGAVSAFFVPTPRQKHAGEMGQPFPWNPLAGIVRDISFLKQRKDLFLASLANGYFWLLGLIFATNIMVYGKEHLGLDESQNTLLSLLPACIGIGIAAGAMLAGRWSGKKVELGLVPLGGVGMALAGIALYFSITSYGATAIILLLAGVCGGLFTIPLYAYLQVKAKEAERGRVLATAGIINGLCLLLGSALYHLLAVELTLSPRIIFLLMGFVTAGVVVYTCTIIPQFFIRFLGWLLVHTIYRVEIIGVEHVPDRGPALLTPNHVSFVDALLISSTVQRFIRFVMIKQIYQNALLKPILEIMDVIPIAPYDGRESVSQSLNKARERLQQGHVVCIFPEGKLTVSGQMQEFRPGFEAIMSGLDYPIIPVYLHNVWGSIFSFEGGKYFWKLPKRLPYPITIYYGQPLPANAKAHEVAAAVQALAEEIEAKSKSKQASHRLPAHL